MWGQTTPYAPMSSTCFAHHWFISAPFGGMRMRGVTAGGNERCSTICRLSSMYCRQSRRSLMSYALCSASKMIPSYGATDNATALSTVGGAKTVTGIPPFSSARMTVFRRGIAAMLPPFSYDHVGRPFQGRRGEPERLALHQQASETPIEEPFG